jgi:Ca2+-binding EF-hand superfamily protein
VQTEIRQSEIELRKEMQTELDVFQNTNLNVCESTLNAMIEEFDLNEDGVIDMEEFRRIVEPILS